MKGGGGGGIRYECTVRSETNQNLYRVLHTTGDFYISSHSPGIRPGWNISPSWLVDPLQARGLLNISKYMWMHIQRKFKTYLCFNIWFIIKKYMILLELKVHQVKHQFTNSFNGNTHLARKQILILSSWSRPYRLREIPDQDSLKHSVQLTKNDSENKNLYPDKPSSKNILPKRTCLHHTTWLHEYSITTVTNLISTYHKNTLKLF